MWQYLILPLIVLLACLGSARAQQLGDIDSDKVATVRDLALIVEHMKGAAPLDAVKTQLADLNRDGVVNDLDIAELLKEILQTRTPELLPLTTVRSTSPYAGEADVAVTRETVVHFSIPLALNTVLDTSAFYGEFGGKKILARAEVSSDRMKATLFYLQPLPSSARIAVTLNGAGILDILGREVDFDGDGAAGGTHSLVFSTLSITPVATTAISGRVFASARATGGSDLPLGGVTVTVDGAEETLRTVTDSLGNFTLSPCPAGSFFVHIDGRTSPQSSYPSGAYYPTVGKQWDAVAGRADNLAGNTADVTRGTIYLPLITAGTLKTASQTQDTPVTFPAAVINANPTLAGVKLDVPANSLFADDGTRGGRVGIAPVAPDRIPSPLPPGLNLPLVITVQTDGGTNFDRPVPVTFPNLPDPVTGVKKAPGEKSALWSFNHDTGQWEVVGPMTVSADGNFVNTDAGVGILQPGWHGELPGCEIQVTPVPKIPGDNCPRDWLGIVKDGLSLGVTAAILAPAFGIGAPVSAGVAALAGVAGLVDAAVTLSNSSSAFDSVSGAVGAVDSALSLSGAAVATPYKGPGTIINIKYNLIGYRDNLIPPSILQRVVHSPAVNMTGKILGITGGALTAYSLAQKLFNPCPDQSLSKNSAGISPGELMAALNSFHSNVEESSNMILQCAAEITSDKLGPLLPSDRNVLIFTENQKIVIIEMNGDAYKHPITGQNFEVPIRDLISEKIEIPEFRNEIASQIISAQKKLSSTWTAGGAYDLLGDAISAVEFNFEKLESSLTDPAGNYRNNAIRYKITDVNGISRRGVFYGQDSAKLILPGQSQFTVELSSEFGDFYGGFSFFSPQNGVRMQFREIPIVKNFDKDSDNDDLADNVEDIIGTDLSIADTDNDGISDGAEVRQGSNPLGALVVATGTIASAPTQAASTDIVAVNNMTVTANGANGITVFNVLNGLNPSRIAEIDTAGQAVAVACSGDFVAVADYQAGLAVVDLTNPSAIGIRHQISFGSPVVAVAASGPLAFAGTADRKVHLVDLPSGGKLGQVTLTGDGDIQDLGVSGDVLYALQTGMLSAVQWRPTLTVTGTALATDQGNVRKRLFAGTGTVYSSWLKGFDIFDTSANPRRPTFVRQFSTQQFGWKQLVANGSGLGLAAAGPNESDDGPHEIDVYNLGADGRQSEFLATLTTPGVAAAVSIYNGMAYVADSTAGLQVVNYLAYDNKKVPPTITLSSGFNLAAGLAEEGNLMRLTAAVTDDVQVRNVEFYLDDALVVIDGNYPFETRFVTPAISDTKKTFKVKARATDTGGNATWSTEYTLTLVPDATPPTVVAFLPEDGMVEQFANAVSVRFNEPVLENTLLAGFTLSSAGPDKIHGNTDDVAVSVGALEYSAESNVAVLAFNGILPPGRYEIRVSPPVSDAAGNVLAQAQTSRFIVPGPGDVDADDLPDDYESLLGLDPTKRDTDGNGIPDGKEDTDQDGLENGLEIRLGFRPNLADSDGNGIPDGDEDRDFDGLTDRQELALGTNWLNPDTDGDTVPDEAEVTGGSDPLDATSTPYTRPGGVYASQAAVRAFRYVFESGAGGFVGAVQPPVQAFRLDITGDIPALGTVINYQAPVRAFRLDISGDNPALGTVIGYQAPVRAFRLDLSNNGGPGGQPGGSISFGTVINQQPPVQVHQFSIEDGDFILGAPQVSVDNRVNP